MFNIGYPEMVLVLAIALIVFGPKKLPEIGRTIGQSLRELKRASNEIMSAVNEPEEDEERPKKHEIEEGET
ncbi:MAG: twin-arginine translocase TatA/TatE family subunit [Armatimonadetes bacterium]|nr:twin-arginine translocase TatA/TatE family subunit [Armatimonadota bacterium]